MTREWSAWAIGMMSGDARLNFLGSQTLFSEKSELLSLVDGCFWYRHIGCKERDRFSRARISRARAFGSAREVSRTLSKSADAFCRSRKFFEAAGTSVVANFMQHRAESAVPGEIFIDLAIPSSALARANECSELDQFLRRKLIDGGFDFGEAHMPKIVGSNPERNACARIEEECGALRPLLR